MIKTFPRKTRSQNQTWRSVSMVLALVLGISTALVLLVGIRTAQAAPPEPHQVMDINTDTDSSSLRYPVMVGDTLFFAANDGSSGWELWKSDGTPAGTVRVKDIRAGEDSSSPEGLIALGDTLFFVANDGSAGKELWKSAGSPPGSLRDQDL